MANGRRRGAGRGRDNAAGRRFARRSGAGLNEGRSARGRGFAVGRDAGQNERRGIAGEHEAGQNEVRGDVGRRVGAAERGDSDQLIGHARKAIIVGGRRRCHKKAKRSNNSEFTTGFNFEVQSVWTQMAVHHPDHLESNNGCGAFYPTISIHHFSPIGGEMSREKYKADQLASIVDRLSTVWPCLNGDELCNEEDYAYWKDIFRKHAGHSGMSTLNFFQTAINLYDTYSGSLNGLIVNDLVTVETFTIPLPFDGTLKLRRLPLLLKTEYKQRLASAGVVVPNVWIVDCINFKVGADLQFVVGTLQAREKRGGGRLGRRITMDDRVILPSGTILDLIRRLNILV